MAAVPSTRARWSTGPAPGPRHGALARALSDRVTGSVRGMPEHGTREAVYLPDAACHGVELAADRPREARPSCKDELSRAGPAQREGVEGGFRTGDRWERVVDFVVGARQ